MSLMTAGRAATLTPMQRTAAASLALALGLTLAACSGGLADRERHSPPLILPSADEVAAMSCAEIEGALAPQLAALPKVVQSSAPVAGTTCEGDDAPASASEPSLRVTLEQGATAADLVGTYDDLRELHGAYLSQFEEGMEFIEIKVDGRAQIFWMGYLAMDLPLAEQILAATAEDRFLAANLFTHLYEPTDEDDPALEPHFLSINLYVDDADITDPDELIAHVQPAWQDAQELGALLGAETSLDVTDGSLLGETQTADLNLSTVDGASLHLPVPPEGPMPASWGPIALLTMELGAQDEVIFAQVSAAPDWPRINVYRADEAEGPLTPQTNAIIDDISAQMDTQGYTIEEVYVGHIGDR